MYLGGFQPVGQSCENYLYEPWSIPMNCVLKDLWIVVERVCLCCVSICVLKFLNGSLPSLKGVKGSTNLEKQGRATLKSWRTACYFFFLSNHLQDHLLNAENISCIQIHTSFSESKSLKKKQSLEYHFATWIQLWNVLESTVLCQSCAEGQKGFGDHWLVSILTHCSWVAGLDERLVISTTPKQEQKGFVVSTQTVGNFPIHTASQEAGIQVVKY